MNILYTKEKYWLEKWDEFVSNDDRGSHLALSDWLRSYESYGFDFEIAIFLEDEKIIGGFGAVIAKKLFFKFYIVPHGPILSKGFENNISFAVNEIFMRSKKIKCCYVQYSIPFSDNSSIASHSYDSSLKIETEEFWKKGNLFKYIYSSYGINWVSFEGTKSSEELLQKFALQPRRNIGLAYRNDIEVLYAKTEEDCKLAYSLIELNASAGNYSVRKFEDFKATILSLIDKENAFLLTASFDKEIKGSAFIVKCGNYLTYISGGTKKEKPDLNIGYILHWEAIKMSYRLGYEGYNISMGGSVGVQNFKAKFTAEAVFFDEPYYHFILKPTVFNAYLSLNNYLKKYKKTISIVLKKIK